jgi:hypothetical protein
MDSSKQQDQVQPSLRLYALVRVRQLLRSPEEYDGWHVNQRPPRIGDLGTIVKILKAPELPLNYVVEASDPDGATVWLGDFLEDELEAAET